MINEKGWYIFFFFWGFVFVAADHNETLVGLQMDSWTQMEKKKNLFSLYKTNVGSLTSLLSFSLM